MDEYPSFSGSSRDIEPGYFSDPYLLFHDADNVQVGQTRGPDRPYAHDRKQALYLVHPLQIAFQFVLIGLHRQELGLINNLHRLASWPARWPDRLYEALFHGSEHS